MVNARPTLYLRATKCHDFQHFPIRGVEFSMNSPIEA
jgi:hypothetical protein